MEKLGVISKVDQPTEWGSHIVVVPNSNDKVRICLDPLKVSENIIRKAYPLLSLEQILAQLSGFKDLQSLIITQDFGKYLKQKNHLWYTTFITPFGKYRYDVLPFGISPAYEHYWKVMKENLSDCCQ